MKKIAIGAKELEDFIWMSYRYCIGRKTIAACMHASTIADLLYKNPDILSKDRKEFMAQDIRQSIINTISWNKQIKIVNQYNNPIWDIYSAILEASSDVEHPYEVIYTVDIEARTVTTEKSNELKELSGFEKFDSMYYDLIPWVKLANVLDASCHKKIVCEHAGKTHEEVCFPYAAAIPGGGYNIVWASLAKDSGHTIDKQGYVIPEMITQIKNI